MNASKKGSITVFLALLLTMMVSLVMTGLDSVRLAASRTQILNALDIGLYSLFAQYDRALLDKYDIFALDASGGDGTLDLAALYDEIEAYMLPMLGQNSHRLTLIQGGLSGFSLLTDNQGGIFYRQVVEYMQQTLAAQGILAVEGRMQARQQSTSQAREAGRRVENGETIQTYDNAMEEAARQSEAAQEEMRTAAAAGGDFDSGDFDDGDADGGDGFDSGDIDDGETGGDHTTPNPIPVIRRIREMGILSLVLPSSNVLSDTVYSENILLSTRTIQQGFGLDGWASDAMGVTAAPLFQQYMMAKLGNYRTPSATGLNYQVEYVLGRSGSDRTNLELVAKELLLIREGVNAACLAADSNKMAQIRMLSVAIAAGFLVPPAALAIEAALVVCWAFAESILDVRELFAGGKVPLVKMGDQWQLSLENLPDLLSRLDSDRRTDDNGMSYEDYLQVLLLTKSQGEKAMRTLDMIEQTLRQTPGWGAFRLDSCVVALGAYAEVFADRRKVLTADKMYGYT